MKEFIEEINSLLGKNQIELAIDKISEVIGQNHDLNKDLVIIKSRLNDIKQMNNRGTIDYELVRKQKNQLIQGVLDLTKSIPSDDYISHVEKSQIVVDLRKDLDVLNSALELNKNKFSELKDLSVKQKSEIQDLKSNIYNFSIESSFLRNELGRHFPLVDIESCKFCNRKGIVHLKKEKSKGIFGFLKKLLGTSELSLLNDKEEKDTEKYDYFEVKCPYCEKKQKENMAANKV